MIKKKNSSTHKADTKSGNMKANNKKTSDKNDEKSEERREMERRGGDRRESDRDGGEERRLDERRDKIQNIADAAINEECSNEEMSNDLQKEVCNLKEVLQRRQADFENYKKRVMKQQEDQKKFAIKNIALDIIQINDDLLRALEASSDIPNGESIDEAHKSFVTGVSLISGRIEETLGKYGVVEIESLDKAFDPNFHEAVEIEESPEVDVDTVTKIYQKGFCIDEIVLRSTKVRVSRPGKSEEDEVQSSDEKEKKSDEK